jgi:hypothetical protein
MRSYLLTFLMLSSFHLLGSPRASRADIPEADPAFLDDAVPSLRALTDKALEGPPNVAGSLSSIRDLLALRRKVFADLGKKHPLTDLTGIATADEYDADVLASLRRIGAAAMASDTARPGDAALQPIEGALASLPPLGKQPFPLIVLTYSELALAVGDSMVSRGSPAMVVDHVVLDHIVAAADLALNEGDDFSGNGPSHNLRQELVLLRLRCPKDRSTYLQNTEKNQVKETGDISTLYYLQCSKCGEPRIVEFPQALASRLNRMAEMQKQVKPAAPTRSQIVEP